MASREVVAYCHARGQEHAPNPEEHLERLREMPALRARKRPQDQSHTKELRILRTTHVDEGGRAT